MAERATSRAIQASRDLGSARNEIKRLKQELRARISPQRRVEINTRIAQLERKAESIDKSGILEETKGGLTVTKREQPQLSVIEKQISERERRGEALTPAQQRFKEQMAKEKITVTQKDTQAKTLVFEGGQEVTIRRREGERLQDFEKRVRASADRAGVGITTLEAKREKVRKDARESIRKSPTDIVRSVSDSGKPLLSEKEERFAERARGVTERQERFFQSEGFKRIEATAGVLTFARGKPLGERGFVGQTAQKFVGGIMSFPIALGGGLVNVGEKVSAFTNALFIPGARKQIPGELSRAVKETKKVFDVRTPEGVSTVLTAVFFAGLSPTLKAKTRQGKAFKGIETEIKNIEAKNVEATGKFEVERVGTERTSEFLEAPKIKRSVKQTKFGETKGVIETEKIRIRDVIGEEKAVRTITSKVNPDAKIRLTLDKKKGVVIEERIFKDKVVSTRESKVPTKETPLKVEIGDPVKERPLDFRAKKGKVAGRIAGEQQQVQITTPRGQLSGAVASQVKEFSRIAKNLRELDFAIEVKDTGKIVNPLARRKVTQAQTGFGEPIPRSDVIVIDPQTGIRIKEIRQPRAKLTTEIEQKIEFDFSNIETEFLKVRPKGDTILKDLAEGFKSERVSKQGLVTAEKTVTVNVPATKIKLSSSQISSIGKSISQAVGLKPRTVGKAFPLIVSKDVIPKSKEIIQTKEKVKPISKTLPSTIVKPDVKVIQKSKPEIKTSDITKTKSEVKTKVSPDVKVETKVSPDVKTESLVRSEVATDTKQRQETVSKQIQKSSSQISSDLGLGSDVLKLEKLRAIAPPLSFGFPDRDFSLGKGFDVFVRKQGKFVKANPLAISREDALDLGASIVDNTALASFKIQEAFSPVEDVGGLGTKGSFSKLRKDLKFKQGIFIEQPSKRISTPGEVRQISRKGVESIKRKSKFKNLLKVR